MKGGSTVYIRMRDGRTTRQESKGGHLGKGGSNGLFSETLMVMEDGNINNKLSAKISFALSLARRPSTPASTATKQGPEWSERLANVKMQGKMRCCP